MCGHVRQLSPGHYLARISAGWDPVTGKRSQPSRVVRGSRQDAELAFAALRVRHSRRWFPSCDTTLNGLVEEFLFVPTRSGRRREPGSRYRELRRYQLHVEPGLGDRVADGINAYELTRLYGRSSLAGTRERSLFA